MSRFVRTPNLPSDCSHLIICEKYQFLFSNALKDLKVETILMPDNPRLSGHVAFHTDLSVFHAGDDKLFISDYFEPSSFYRTLKTIGTDINFFSKKESSGYPNDSVANICLNGSFCICNPASADPAIVERLRHSNMRLIPVRQGYTRCSTCVVDDSSIITADPGISTAARKAGLNVLQIEPGHVRLDGYKYGFIGGATFKTARHKLCFTGTLDDFTPADNIAILRFLEERNISPVFLTNKPLFDIGSAVPLLEK